MKRASKKSTKNSQYQDPVYMTDCMPSIMSGFPFNRNSWHDPRPLQRQESMEGSPSPQMSSSPTSASSNSNFPPILRHNHSLKYSGGALHGNESPKMFDHNFEDNNTSERFVQGNM